MRLWDCIAINIRVFQQVENLTRKAQLQEVKLETSTKQLKDAIAIAGEETAKCKAAKEVIRSLTAQVRNLWQSNLWMVTCVCLLLCNFWNRYNSLHPKQCQIVHIADYVTSDEYLSFWGADLISGIKLITLWLEERKNFATQVDSDLSLFITIRVFWCVEFPDLYMWVFGKTDL